MHIPGLQRNAYVDHSGNINDVLTKNNISYDLLHGTRSSTLKSMYADGVGADIKGALLSRNEAGIRGVRPETGNFKANVCEGSDWFEDPVTKGEYVSTASLCNANLAHFYATDTSFNNDPENYPVIFAIKQDNLETTKFVVGIPRYSDERENDFAVKRMIPRESISAVLVPKDHATETERLGGNIRVFGYDF